MGPIATLLGCIFVGCTLVSLGDWVLDSFLFASAEPRADSDNSGDSGHFDSNCTSPLSVEEFL